MTIDKRVDRLLDEIEGAGPAVRRVLIRRHMQEAMKDQRHACAEAVMALDGETSNEQRLIHKAHGNVMNAEVK